MKGKPQAREERSVDCPADKIKHGDLSGRLTGAAGKASSSLPGGTTMGTPDTPSSRRQAYMSVNHLLSFEVTSSSGGRSSPPRRRHGPKPGASFTKERFIHAK